MLIFVVLMQEKDNNPQKFYRFRSLVDWNSDRFLSEMADIQQNELTFVHPKLFNDPFEVYLEDREQLEISNIKNYLGEMYLEIDELVKKINVDKDIPQALKKDYSDIIQKYQRSFTANGYLDLDLYRELEALLEKIKKDDYPQNNDIYRFVHLNIEKMICISKNIRIACFNKEINSMYFWSHYAAAHKGYAIEYTVKSLNQHQYIQYSKFDDGSIITFPQEVDYRSNKEWTVSGRPLWGHLIKSPDWAMEKEYRMLYASDTKSEIARIPLDHMQITAIYLGLRADKNARTVQYLKQIARNKGIAVYEMQKNEPQTSLEAKKIHQIDVQIEPNAC